MDSSYLKLQAKLEEIIGPDYKENIYFQPPPSTEMHYPAIKFQLNDIDNKHADNGVYMQNIGYMITVIDRDPDSQIVREVSKLSSVKFDRHFKTSDLNHTVFTIYY